MNAVSEVRSFNRFYTRRIGLLAEHLPASDFSLAEARVLYEIAQREQSAAEVARALAMDKAHLSRIVSRFRKRGLVLAQPDPRHGKRLVLRLTEVGREVFAQMNQGTERQMAALLQPLGEERRRRLVAALGEAQAAFGPEPAQAPEAALRAMRAGDAGWIVHRQAVLYNQEYGWDWTYEALVAEILAGFIKDFDPARENAWIAEKGGATVGSVFLMKSDDPTVAKLRLLYVESGARGSGIGRRLVEACVSRARELGYARLTLWTNSVLVSARRIYEAVGFRLVEEAPHRSFGHDLVGQTWTLDLAP